jgi:hypothetical protein
VIVSLSIIFASKQVNHINCTKEATFFVLNYPLGKVREASTYAQREEKLEVREGIRYSHSSVLADGEGGGGG